MVEALGQFFSVQLAAWVATMGLLAHYWRTRNERLRDAANEKVSDWTRLRDEITRLSEAEKTCREDFDKLHRHCLDLDLRHAEEITALKAELAELRGYFAGQGKASQEAAGIVALERLNRNGKPAEGSET
jgi:hypothetical protein